MIEEIKEAWGWIGLTPKEVVGENAFGNVLIKDTSGKYWRLCPEDVYCEIVANNENEFEQLIFEHENIMSNALGKPRIIDEYFSDYWGAIKSLGAWGGDFMLATSSKSMAETRDYFEKRGYSTILSFDELILQNFEKYGAVNSNEANEQKNVQL